MNEIKSKEKEMKQLVCEMCGSTDLIKQDGFFACQNCGTKMALTKLAEKIHFSDSMSNEVLSDLEEEIAEKVKKLKTTDKKTEIIKINLEE